MGEGGRDEAGGGRGVVSREGHELSVAYRGTRQEINGNVSSGYL